MEKELDPTKFYVKVGTGTSIDGPYTTREKAEKIADWRINNAGVPKRYVTILGPEAAEAPDPETPADSETAPATPDDTKPQKRSSK